MKHARSRRVSLSKVVAIERRRYRLQHLAVEVFTHCKSFLLAFRSPAARDRFFKRLRKARLPPTTMVLRTADDVRAARDALVKLWRAREVSNFEYLMRLNRLAGRTYHDLSQYPVLPWVLSNYTSDTLNLRDPANYRDFQYPMGAQTPARRDRAREQYEISAEMYDSVLAGADENMQMFQGPPWHFGSNYSNAGFVAWYLLRVEPFTTYHLILQDGKFDRPDRQFHSIAGAYHSCTTSSSDVKELTPEWFYFPEFLRNANGLDLGDRQDGVPVRDVVLPPWACGSPEVFVRLHRAALESEIVSQRLHHWVDLVFGFKQRGPHLPGVPAALGDEAVKANNVFFHLMYEGAVDLEKLRSSDPELCRRVMSTIDNFGQIPPQMWVAEHPQRDTPDKCDLEFPLLSRDNMQCTVCCPVVGLELRPRGWTRCPTQLIPWSPLSVPLNLHSKAVLFLGKPRHGQRLVTVAMDRTVGVHLWRGEDYHDGTLAVDARLPRTAATVATVQAAMSSKASVRLLEHPRAGSAGGGPVCLGVPFARAGVAAASGALDDGSVTGARAARAGAGAGAAVGAAGTAGAAGAAGGPLPSAATASGGGASARPWWLGPQLFALTSDGAHVVSAGHWDDSFKVTALDTGRVTQSIALHRNIVTCVALAQALVPSTTPIAPGLTPAHHALSADGGDATQSHHDVLVTGSLDATVRVWDIHDGVVAPNPRFVLFGHDDAVTSVAVSTAQGVILSGSNDGTIIMHSLRKGHYLRTIAPHGSWSTVQRQRRAPTAPGAEGAPGVGAGAPSAATAAGAAAAPSVGASAPHDDAAAAAAAAAAEGLHGARAAGCVGWVGVSEAGVVAMYSSDEHVLRTFTLNGTPLSQPLTLAHRKPVFAWTQDGQHLIVAGDAHPVLLEVRDAYSLVVILRIGAFGARFDGDVRDPAPLPEQVTSIAFTPHELSLLVGLRSGRIMVFVKETRYLRLRIEGRLRDVGFT